MSEPSRSPIDPSQQPDDDFLLAKIQSELETLLNCGMTSEGNRALTPVWSARTDEAMRRLVTSDRRLNVDALRHFRRDQILVDDVPVCDLGDNRWKNNAVRNVVVGWRRATRACLVECLRVLQKRGFDHLLRTYPCLSAGHPHTFQYGPHQYTFRWARHVYFLGLLKRILHDRLGGDFVVLDIGSSYGIFSSLVKREYPASHHVLVDMPEQLILARYFLGCCLPEARVAGVNELLREPAITKDLILDYDFVLVPTSLFGKLSANSVDLVTNFASLSEMTGTYFDFYTRSDVFRSSKYFYTINRIEAYPETAGQGNVSICDFPIADPRKRLHFGICPIFSVNFLFRQRCLFFTSRVDPPPYFEYIGKT